MCLSIGISFHYISIVSAQTENTDKPHQQSINRPQRSTNRLIVKLKTDDALSAPQSARAGQYASPELLRRRIEKKDELTRRHHLGSSHAVFPQSKHIKRANLYYKVEIPEGKNMESVLQELKRDPNVEWAEPVITYSTESIQPDDPEYSNMNRQYLSLLNLEEAWSTNTGSRNVVVAIVDTGIDYLHEDLKDNIWTNNNEIPDNGIDDDGNGFVDDVHGWDFVSVDPGTVADGEDPGPPDNNPMDFQGHGTHVAGIVGAKGNNGIGVTGVAWDVSLMAVRAGYADGSGSGQLQTDDIAAALYYACDNGADIINMSFGSAIPSMVVKEALSYCSDKGVLLIAGAGNNSSNSLFFPAAYNNVLAVAATEIGNYKASYSNYGIWVDLAAPGTNIYSTTPGNTYGLMSGTSMATPIVSGMAALIKSQFPDSTAEDITLRLLATATPLSSIDSKYFEDLGTGIVKADLTTSTSILPTHVNVVSMDYKEAGANANGFLNEGEIMNVRPTLRNYSVPEQDVTVTISTTDPYLSIIDGTINISNLPSNRKVTPDTDVFQVKLVPGIPNNYTGVFNLTISDAYGVIYNDTFHTTILNPIMRSEVLASSLANDMLSYIRPNLIEHPDHSISLIYESEINEYGGRIYHRVRDVNGAWSETANIPDPLEQPQTSPSLAMGSDGKLRMIYKQLVGESDQEIFYAVYDPNTKIWNAMQLTHGAGLIGTVVNGNLNTATIKLALDHNNRPVVFWTDWRDGTADIYMMQYDGTEWSDEQLIFDLNLVLDDGLGKMQLYYFEDANNVPTLIWTQKTGSEVLFKLYYSQLVGGNWSAPALVTAKTIINFDAKVDPNNIIHLAFVDGSSHGYFYTYFNGDTWSNADTEIITGDFFRPGQHMHQIIINNDGQPEIYVLKAFDGLYRSVFDGTNWSAEELFYSDPRITSEFEYWHSLLRTSNNEFLLATVDIFDFDESERPLFVVSSNEYPSLVPDKPTYIVSNSSDNTKLAVNITPGSTQVAGFFATFGSAPGVNDLVPVTQTSTGNQLDVYLDNANSLLPAQAYYANLRAYNNTGYLSPVTFNNGIFNNTIPQLSVTSPAAGTVFNVGTQVTFSADAYDVEDGDISNQIKWNSDRSATLGTGGELTISNLVNGPHTITASITDSSGVSVESTMEITINVIPTLSILGPSDGLIIEKGDSVTFSAQAYDGEDGDLSDKVRWSSDINGVLGTGNIKTSSLPVGGHRITASVTDSNSATVAQAISINVVFTDSDNDGIQDNYEIAHGLNPNDPADAAQDKDGDGLSNLQEFLLGTSIDLADTDNDNVSDAVEVKSGRNPLLNEPALIQIIMSNDN